MIIGHLPSGYVLSKWIANKLSRLEIDSRHVILAGVIGAIAPDFDILYFHLIDNRQQHHHTYLSHYPVLWLSLIIVASVWHKWAVEKAKAMLALFFCVAAFMHLILDSVVGDIWWFAPFIDQSYAMFTIPAIYKPWWLNFILHWSFILEILLSIWAILLWRRRPVAP